MSGVEHHVLWLEGKWEVCPCPALLPLPPLLVDKQRQHWRRFQVKSHKILRSPQDLMGFQPILVPLLWYRWEGRWGTCGAAALELLPPEAATSVCLVVELALQCSAFSAITAQERHFILVESTLFLV